MTNHRSRFVLLILVLFCLLFVGGHDPDIISARRERIIHMSTEEKVRLAQLWERFNTTSEEEQEHLRQLANEIDNDEHADELRAVMSRYYQWCSALPTYERLQLLELPSAKRVAHIAKIIRDNQNTAGLQKWLDENADQIIAKLPQQQQRQLAVAGPFVKRFVLVRLLANMSRRTDDEDTKLLSDQDLAALRAQLSTQTSRFLESKTPSEQWALIGEKLRRHYRAEMTARRLTRLTRGQRPAANDIFGIADEELAKVFTNLPAEQQDVMLSLPAEEMQDNLHQLYLERRFPRPNRFDRRGRPDSQRHAPPHRPRHRLN